METEMKLRNPHQEIFLALYEETFPKVCRWIQKSGGNLEQARDIFQDAIVIYYEKTNNAGFVPTINNEAYLLGISKFLWYKKLRLEQRAQQARLDINLEIEDYQEPVATEKILSYLERAGKKCMELLRAFYYDRKTMREISDQFKFSGERSATVQKFKCLEKVRDSIQEQALTTEDFYA